MKKVLAIAAVIMLMYVSAFASSTRLSGTDLPAQLTDSDQLIYYYPSLIQNYGSEAVAEYNGTAFGYALFKMKSSALGLGLVPSPGIMPVAVTTGLIDLGAVPDSPTLTLPANVITAIYGFNLGKTAVAASIMYGSDSTSLDTSLTGGLTAKDAGGAGAMYLKIALGATLNIGMPLDVGLSLALPSYNSHPKLYTNPPAAVVLVGDSYESLGAMDLNFGARLVNESMIYNLMVDFTSVSGESNLLTYNAAGTTTANTVFTSSNSAISAALLAGNKINALKNLDVTVGGGLGATTIGGSPKDKTDNKLATTVTYGGNANSQISFAVPVYISADCKLNDTFEVNAGVNKSIASIVAATTETVLIADGSTVQNKATSTNLNFNAPVNAAACLTGTWGDAKVDLLFNLAWFTAGNQSLTSSVGLTYAWK